MSPAPEEEPRVRPLRLLFASALAAAAFTFVLAVAAYALQDVPFGEEAEASGDAAPGTSSSLLPPSADTTPPEALDEGSRQASLRALAPVVERCLAESRRQDPAIGDTLELEVPAHIEGGAISFGSPGLPPSTSPFLRGCLQRAVPRATVALDDARDRARAGALRLVVDGRGARLAGHPGARDAGVAADGG